MIPLKVLLYRRPVKQLWAQVLCMQRMKNRHIWKMDVMSIEYWHCLRNAFRLRCGHIIALTIRGYVWDLFRTDHFCAQNLLDIAFIKVNGRWKMRESIKVIIWCSIVSTVFLILTYAVTVNTEAHFVVLDSVWISNDFLITLFGGVFASMLVVLLCEIQKYLSSKRRTEQYLFYQSLYLYQALVQTRIFIEDYLSHEEWILPDNLFDESVRKIQCQLNAIQTTDYATFKHGENSLMVEHGRFCVDVLPKLQPILQCGNRLRISINEAKIEYLQKQIDTSVYIFRNLLITSKTTPVNKVLQEEKKNISSYEVMVDSYITNVDEYCNKRFKWESLKGKLVYSHLEGQGNSITMH